MGETKATLEATAETASPATSAALKVARLLGDLETYVCGQSDIIIDYATARRREEPISTAITESTVQWLLHRRARPPHHQARSHDIYQDHCDICLQHRRVAQLKCLPVEEEDSGFGFSSPPTPSARVPRP